MEMRNIGSFESPVRVPNEIPSEIQLPKMLEVCEKYGVLLKEHNTDYLSDEALQWHPRLGIHSANVAPEFGVLESRALVECFDSNGLCHFSERFLEIAYASKKWAKWMVDNTSASDRDRAIIAGHYVFSLPEVIDLKKQAAADLVSLGVDLDIYLKERIKTGIMRYLRNFRLI